MNATARHTADDSAGQPRGYFYNCMASRCFSFRCRKRSCARRSTHIENHQAPTLPNVAPGDAERQPWTRARDWHLLQFPNNVTARLPHNLLAHISRMTSFVDDEIAARNGMSGRSERRYILQQRRFGARLTFQMINKHWGF